MASAASFTATPIVEEQPRPLRSQPIEGSFGALRSAERAPL
jgi:hypothetical protein